MAINYKQPEKPIPSVVRPSVPVDQSKPKFNKREWMRLYMREYRKRAKK